MLPETPRNSLSYPRDGLEVSTPHQGRNRWFTSCANAPAGRPHVPPSLLEGRHEPTPLPQEPRKPSLGGGARDIESLILPGLVIVVLVVLFATGWWLTIVGWASDLIAWASDLILERFKEQAEQIGTTQPE